MGVLGDSEDFEYTKSDGNGGFIKIKNRSQTPSEDDPNKNLGPCAQTVTTGGGTPLLKACDPKGGPAQLPHVDDPTADPMQCQCGAPTSKEGLISGMCLAGGKYHMCTVGGDVSNCTNAEDCVPKFHRICKAVSAFSSAISSCEATS
jgi:hypothetical protein